MTANELINSRGIISFLLVSLFLFQIVLENPKKITGLNYFHLRNLRTPAVIWDLNWAWGLSL